MARLPVSAQLWRDRAEIDYIGPFVKAWAAFNAWYRAESGSRRDRVGLDYVKGHANPIRSEILPHLGPAQNDPAGRRRPDSEAAQEFKLLIAQLHSRLEAFRIEVGREDDTVERITFSSVAVRRPSPPPQTITSSRITFTVNKTHGQWVSSVTNRAGQVTTTITQADYDETAFVTHPHFLALSITQQSHFRAAYQLCCPRPLMNLLAGTEPVVAVGDLEFRCSDEDLFGGLVEVIYSMRNALLHGELQADERAFQTYEPAYRIVMKFLECVR